MFPFAAVTSPPTPWIKLPFPVRVMSPIVPALTAPLIFRSPAEVITVIAPLFVVTLLTSRTFVFVKENPPIAVTVPWRVSKVALILSPTPIPVAA